MGVISGSVQVVLYEDYLCGHCGRLNEEIFDAVAVAHGGHESTRVGVAIKPVDLRDKFSTPPGYSTRAGALVEGVPGWSQKLEVRRLLFSRMPAVFGSAELYSESRLLAVARAAQIDKTSATRYLTSGAGRDKVRANMASLMAMSGRITVVPTVVINGAIVPPRSVVDSLRALLH